MTTTVSAGQRASRVSTDPAASITCSKLSRISTLGWTFSTVATRSSAAVPESPLRPSAARIAPGISVSVCTVSNGTKATRPGKVA